MKTKIFPGSLDLEGSDGNGGTRDVYAEYQGIQFDHYYNNNTQEVLRIDNYNGGSIRSYGKNNGTTPSSQTYWEFGHAGDLDCPNHYRLGYYGSITAGYGGFLQNQLQLLK